MIAIILIPLVGAAAVNAFSTGINRNDIVDLKEIATEQRIISGRLLSVIERLEKNDDDKEHRLRSLEHEAPHSSQERVS